MDYTPTNATITFGPGESVKQVKVPIINNSLIEGNQTVVFALSNAVNAVMASPSNTTLTIIDTVVAPGELCFSATNYMVSEGDGSALVTVVRTNGTSGSVSVGWNAIPGTALPGVNYTTPTNGSITFNNGDTTKTFAVPLVRAIADHF